MKVVVAVDSYKGSASAAEAAAYIKEGILRADRNTQVTLLPLADGGEGTVEALTVATGGRIIREMSVDPLGRTVDAFYGLLPDGTAVIETAAASGLTLLRKDERDALKSSSYGTGLLIKSALLNGAEKIIIGLGGSATTDGGRGIAKALGIRYLDRNGDEIQEGGADLVRLHSIDTSSMMKEAAKCHFIFASDVTNHLWGKDGAAYVYGPQKGADEKDVETLDKALRHYSSVLLEGACFDTQKVVSTGAAGGLACPLLAFCNAEVISGIDFILDTIDFDSKVRDADLVITGEGRLDRQSAFGKVPDGVAGRTKKIREIPVIAIGGSIGDGAEELYDCGVDALVSTVSSITTLDEAIRNVKDNIIKAAERTMKLVLVGRSLK